MKITPLKVQAGLLLALALGGVLQFPEMFRHNPLLIPFIYAAVLPLLYEEK